MHGVSIVKRIPTKIPQPIELNRFILLFNDDPGGFKIDHHRPQREYRSGIENHIAKHQLPVFVRTRARR